MALTEEDVFAAASALDAEGIRPTQKAVRERLGGGSFTTIAAAMQVWHQRRSAPAATRIPIPDVLSKSMEEATQQVWDCAVSEMDIRLRDERRALRDAHAAHALQVADYREALDTLQEEHAQAGRALEQRDQQIQALENELRDALDRTIAAEARLAECAAALTAEREARREAQSALKAALRSDPRR
ncbi:DNA-binding protein [Luteimonas sp. e5]